MPSMVLTGVGDSSVVASPSTVATAEACGISITVRDSAGAPVPGIQAASVVVTVSGSNNTITQPTGVTNADGTIGGASFSSSTAEAKAVTVTVAGLPMTAQPGVTVESVGALDAGTILATGGDGVVTVSEATAPSGGTAPYTRNLYRSTAGGSKGSVLAAGVTLPYADETAVNDTTYYYTLEVDDSAVGTADTAQVSATPAVAAGWRANEPVSMTEFAVSDFTTSTDWNFFAGTTGTACGFDASAVSPPRSSPRTARFVVPTGVQPGRFIGNADPGNFASPAQRVYTCAWIRYSDLATIHPSTWKFWYFYHDTGQTQGGAVIGIRPNSANVTTGGIRLSMESQGGSGTVLWRTEGSVITRGQWHLLETDMQYGVAADGTFRAWIDGVLVLDVTGISYRTTNGGWADLHLDPYYGGNTPGHEVNTDTYLDVDDAYISWSAD